MGTSHVRAIWALWKGQGDSTLDCLAWLSAEMADQLEEWELQLNLGKVQPFYGGTMVIACVNGVNTLRTATAGAEPSCPLQCGSCWLRRWRTDVTSDREGSGVRLLLAYRSGGRT